MLRELGNRPDITLARSSAQVTAWCLRSWSRTCFDNPALLLIAQIMRRTISPENLAVPFARAGPLLRSRWTNTALGSLPRRLSQSHWVATGGIGRVSYSLSAQPLPWINSAGRGPSSVHFTSNKSRSATSGRNPRSNWGTHSNVPGSRIDSAPGKNPSPGERDCLVASPGYESGVNGRRF